MVERIVTLSEQQQDADMRRTLTRERKTLDTRIARLVAAIEQGGGSVASLVTKLQELEARKTALDGEMAALSPVPRLPAEVLTDRLTEWRRLLRASTTQARSVLDRVLAGRIAFTPTSDRSGYTFEAPTRFDRLFAGVAIPAPAWVRAGDTTGIEHISAADTLDVGYGALLDRIVKCPSREKGNSSFR